MKRLLMVFVSVLMVLSLSTAGTAAGKITIGVILPQADADGFRANYIGVRQAAEKLGVDTILLSAQNSVDRQLSQIEDLITQRVGAIIFIPVDSGAMSTGVEKANAAGIPIVAMDRSTVGGKLTGLVESDNVAHGRAGADLIAEAAKKAGIPLKQIRVLELLGDLATSAGLERHKGFEERAKELGMTIVAQLPTHWNNDEALASTLDAFQAHPEINAIFEASDIAMHAGVESALSSLGRLKPAGQKGHIIISAVDGGPNGIKAVRAGYIDGIAAQQLLGMGEMALQIAVKAIKGEPIKDRVIRLAPDLVSPENVDSPTHWANQINL